MRVRGDIEVLMAGAIAALVLVIATGLFCEWHGHKLGLEEKQAEWDRQKLADIAAGQKRDRDVSAALDTLAKSKADADRRAEENETKWKEARREAQRNVVSLGTCVADRHFDVPAGGAAAPSNSGAPAGAAHVLLSWTFVGLHDSAFTGLDGKPLSEAAAGIAADAARAGTPSPYGLDELLEVDSDNARSLSACRRDVDGIRSKVEAAAAAWDNQGGR